MLGNITIKTMDEFTPACLANGGLFLWCDNDASVICCSLHVLRINVAYYYYVNGENWRINFLGSAYYVPSYPLLSMSGSVHSGSVHSGSVHSGVHSGGVHSGVHSGGVHSGGVHSGSGRDASLSTQQIES